MHISTGTRIHIYRMYRLYIIYYNNYYKGYCIIISTLCTFFDMAMIICTCIHWEESIILLAESSMRLRASYVLWSSWVQQIHSSKELSDYGWWVNELRVLELRRPCRIHTALHSKERWQMLLGLRLVACSTLTNAVLMHPTISNHFGIWDG